MPLQPAMQRSTDVVQFGEQLRHDALAPPMIMEKTFAQTPLIVRMDRGDNLSRFGFRRIEKFSFDMLIGLQPLRRIPECGGQVGIAAGAGDRDEDAVHRIVGFRMIGRLDKIVALRLATGDGEQ